MKCTRDMDFYKYDATMYKYTWSVNQWTMNPEYDPDGVITDKDYNVPENVW